MKIAGILIVVDFVIVVLTVGLGFPPMHVLGDLLLLEAATLLLLAGLVDIGSSAAILQLRRVFFSSKEDFSLRKRMDIERRAMVFLFSGLVLLALMILLAIIDFWTQGTLAPVLSG